MLCIIITFVLGCSWKICCMYEINKRCHTTSICKLKSKYGPLNLCVWPERQLKSSIWRRETCGDRIKQVRTRNVLGAGRVAQRRQQACVERAVAFKLVCVLKRWYERARLDGRGHNYLYKFFYGRHVKINLSHF